MSNAFVRSFAPRVAVLGAAGALLVAIVGHDPALASPRAASAAAAPDPAQMVLRPGDIGPGTTTTSQGFVTGDPAFVSTYQREFQSTTTASGVHFLDIVCRVSIIRSLAAARGDLTTVSRRLHSRSGRQSFAGTLRQSLARSGVSVARSALHLGVLRTLRAGDGSLFLPIRLRYRGVPIVSDLVYVRVNRAIGILTLVTVGTNPRAGAATTLTRTLARHMRTAFRSH